MKPVVIKYGGAAMNDTSIALQLMKDIVLLAAEGIRPVLVHGGGPEIERWLSRLGICSEKVEGLRVTDASAIEVVEMVLSGKVNKALVGMIQAAGGKAAGISGRDGGLFSCSVKSVNGRSLGYVGTIIGTSNGLVHSLISGGFIPVISSIGDDGEGHPLNINADEAAAALAVSLKASSLILLTDVPGVLREYPDPDSRIPVLSSAEAENLIASGTIDKGMLPKLRSCVEVVRSGVGTVQIIDGREPGIIRKALSGIPDTGTTVIP